MEHRPINQIKKDIERCQGQISKAMDQHNATNHEDSAIIIEGFQVQLQKLNDELKLANQAINDIEVNDPVFVGVQSKEILNN